jgi:hypothetical protein
VDPLKQAKQAARSSDYETTPQTRPGVPIGTVADIYMDIYIHIYIWIYIYIHVKPARGPQTVFFPTLEGQAQWAKGNLGGYLA